MPEYYGLDYKCDNCYKSLQFKFAKGDTRSETDAGKCPHCGVNDNVLIRGVCKHTPNELAVMPLGKVFKGG